MKSIHIKNWLCVDFDGVMHLLVQTQDTTSLASVNMVLLLNEICVTEYTCIKNIHILIVSI